MDGNCGSGSASAGWPLARMLSVSVNGVPASTSPSDGKPDSFSSTLRAGNHGLPALDGGARASICATGASACTAPPNPCGGALSNPFGLLNQALGKPNPVR